MDLTPLVEYCQSVGISLTDLQLAKFQQFGEALYLRNKVVNLTRVPAEDCAVRHFVDSLMVAEFVPLGSSVLDLGTGPGFPAWPLACLRVDLSVTAIDSNGKMMDFLRGHALNNLTVRQCRAEDLLERESFEVVTGRALAPLAAQLELSAAWVKVGGLCVPFRTPADAGNADLKCLVELGLELESLQERELPGGQGSRLFPLYRKMKPTKSRFPRRWADIKTNPLD